MERIGAHVQEVDDNISGARRVMIQMYRRAMATRHVVCRSGFRQHENRSVELDLCIQGLGAGSLMDNLGL